jgi:hypothetical protein
MPKPPRSRKKGTIKHSDVKIRVTLFEALGGKATMEAELSALGSSFESGTVLDKLMDLARISHGPSDMKRKRQEESIFRGQ